MGTVTISKVRGNQFFISRSAAEVIYESNEDGYGFRDGGAHREGEQRKRVKNTHREGIFRYSKPVTAGRHIMVISFLISFPLKEKKSIKLNDSFPANEGVACHY